MTRPSHSTPEERSCQELKVLAWPAASTANRYPETLYAHLPGTDVDEFFPGWRSIGQVLRRRYDIFHIHWLERAFWRTGRIAVIRAVLVTLTAAMIVKLRSGKLVWTAHDPVPHQMQANAVLAGGPFGLLWRIYSNLLVRMVDGVILLSETHRAGLIGTRPALKTALFAVIPHPHFKGIYPDVISKDDARTQLNLGADHIVLLLLGSLRPYKNAEGLIEAFRKTSNSMLRLVVAGQPDSDSYAVNLTGLAQNDPRIALRLGFVANDELQLFLKASDCVVIPFRNATNSGSVALALSFARPVAVPDIPVFRELAAIVGDEWMQLFNGEISASELEHIVGWIGRSRATEPPLETLGWDHIGARTAEFFRLVRTS
jgi:glycosyltransferase involved in cell wall biosynthesis